MLENIFVLSDCEHNLIKKHMSDLKYDNLGSIEYLNELKRRFFNSFPERIIDLFNSQKSSFEPFPYFIIKNFPIDNVYGAPSFNETGIKYKDGYLSENIITACGNAIAEPYSIFFEGKELVNNLTPERSTSNDYTGLGSATNLDLHIENSALRFMEEDFSPLALLLLGIRYQDSGPITYLADSRKALNALTKKDIDILRSRSFIIKTPHRWRKYFNYENTELIPMVTGDDRYPVVNAVFYDDMILAINDKSNKALNNFYLALQGIKVGIEINVGDLVYIDNRFTLHSRGVFKPRYDHSDKPLRWVQRIFISSNLWEWRHLPRHERVFFKENK